MRFPGQFAHKDDMRYTTAGKRRVSTALAKVGHRYTRSQESGRKANVRGICPSPWAKKRHGRLRSRRVARLQIDRTDQARAECGNSFAFRIKRRCDRGCIRRDLPSGHGGVHSSDYREGSDCPGISRPAATNSADCWASRPPSERTTVTLCGYGMVIPSESRSAFTRRSSSR